MAATGVWWLALALASGAGEITLTVDRPMTAGMSAFRAQWDLPFVLAEDGATRIVDAKVRDRGATAVWPANGKPGALAFDALNRSLLVRFPDAAERIAARLRQGHAIKRATLVLPFLDEELWPPGDPNFAKPDGYWYRANWGVDRLYRAVRPQWHAVAWALRKPWKADGTAGPTFNAAIHGALYWKRYGAADVREDRFPRRFGPTEVSFKQPDGRLDVTAALTDPGFGATLADRLRTLADCGFLVQKWETYDHRYFQGCYEWATATGGRAIRIKTPRLEVVLAKADTPAGLAALRPPVAVDALAERHRAKKTGGAPTAVLPSLDELMALDRKLKARPPHLAQWQWQRVRELQTLFNPHALAEPFWFQFVPRYLVNRIRGRAERADPLAVYGLWVDKHVGRQPRGWSGFESALSMTEWYACKEALPAPARDAIRRYWTAWLMPDRPTAPLKRMRDFTDVSGDLVHPMADDPRVGGKSARVPDPAKGRFDTYYATTGDWRGNKSFFRAGFTHTMSTQNFNTTAAAGALLAGQLIGSDRAIADGRHGLEHWPLRQWMWKDGSGQEHVDHYYYAITLAGNKCFADFAEHPFDRLLGKSLMAKGIEELVSAYHPGLRRFVARSSRTAYEYALGTLDGLHYALHTLSRSGTLTDRGAKTLPDNIQAFGRHVPPHLVAMQTTTGPWAPEWVANLVDRKPLPYEATHRNGGHWRRCTLGRHYGLASADTRYGRIQAIAQWRRAPTQAQSLRDLGTMDVRFGVNATRFVNRGGGWIGELGSHSILQHANKLLVITSPNAYQGGFAGGGLRNDVRTMQTSVILFNYQQPKPTWAIHVDGKPIAALPAKARLGSRVTIHDGVTYIGIVPLPATDLGRRAELVLEEGQPQQPVHSKATLTPALVVNAYLMTRDAPLARDDAAWLRADRAFGGFVIEFGDRDEYGSFAAFQKHIRDAVLDTRWDEKVLAVHVRYASGKDVLEAGSRTAARDEAGKRVSLGANFVYRRVNGRSPYPTDENVLRDTTLSQGGFRSAAKNGARVLAQQGKRVFLQTEPVSGTYAGWNPLPELTYWRLTAPGGVEIISDGRVNIASVTVRPAANALWVDHAHRPGSEGKGAELAAAFLAFGLGKAPTVVVNGATLANPRSVTLDGRPAVVVPLTDRPVRAAALPARLRAARRALGLDP